MMMGDDKKKQAMVIISKMKNGAEKASEAPKSEVGDESDGSAGYMAAAEEVMSAIESKDPRALVEAMKSFHAMCASEEQDEPAGESESSEAE